MASLSIARLYLRHFRNYPEMELQLPALPVVLTGENGAGKTNILEAISFLSPGRGLRNARLSEVGCQSTSGPWAVATTVRTVEGIRDIGTGKVSGSDTRGESDKRAVKIDGKLLKSHTALSEIISVIWLTPQMDGLFLGSASARRRFLDRLVYHFDSGHASYILAYDYARAERAKLLKERRADPAWLLVLERKMAETGIAIAAARVQAVEYVQQAMNSAITPFPKAQLSIQGAVEEALASQPALQVEEAFCAELKSKRQQDSMTGRTNAGIHRSDLLICHQGKHCEASNCSTGEQKALLLSIILAEARARLAWRQSVPIVLLDEVVAHLDAVRREALFAEIEQLGAQVWMTGTDALLFEGIKGRAAMLKVANGKVGVGE